MDCKRVLTLFNSLSSTKVLSLQKKSNTFKYEKMSITTQIRTND